MKYKLLEIVIGTLILSIIGLFMLGAVTKARSNIKNNLENMLEIQKNRMQELEEY